MTVATAYAGESLDALVWRELGRGGGSVEAVLDANPGLAAIAAALPEGTAIDLPVTAAAQATVDLAQLWD